MERVSVTPELLNWACDRSGESRADLSARFPQLEAWIKGDTNPTLKQLEKFAKGVHVSIGYLFLQKPPVETVPIPDLRTMGGRGVKRPSPDMLDVIYLCQKRQDWYREYAISTNEEPREFIGSATIASNVDQVAKDMQRVLGFSVSVRHECHTETDAMQLFVYRAESAGVLVMRSSVVGNNTNRVLDTEEFRGFALSDKIAPLIFVNGRDSKPAQMFTLAHELAHLWLGESAISDTAINGSRPTNSIEVWCNRVAAEFLGRVDVSSYKAMSYRGLRCEPPGYVYNDLSLCMDGT